MLITQSYRKIPKETTCATAPAHVKKITEIVNLEYQKIIPKYLENRLQALYMTINSIKTNRKQANLKLKGHSLTDNLKGLLMALETQFKAAKLVKFPTHHQSKF